MKIVRSVGVSTLVALMSAHREAAEQGSPCAQPFNQAAVEAIEDYLRRIDAGEGDSRLRPSGPRRSHSTAHGWRA